MSYIRCPECGFYLGQYNEFFEEAKKALHQEYIFNNKSEFSDYDPKKIMFNPKIMPNLEIIFNALEIEIKKICCRIRLISSIKPDMSFN